MENRITEEMEYEFRTRLEEEEKAKATVEKYMRDLRSFRNYLKGAEVTKAAAIAYKEHLLRSYAPTSVNSMLETINLFLKRQGWDTCTVRLLKIQREAFRTCERELSRGEYLQLLQEARKQKNQRLSLIIETLGATGIRIGELRFLTVKALQSGRAAVRSKGKQRTVLLPTALCRKLKQYTTQTGRTEGSIFVTRGGRPVDRSNIWREMKRLCAAAGVDGKKVFPHNLRHLFAVTYYEMTKDLPHLADLLGHANINTTRIYTRISFQEQARQIETLGLTL